MNIYNIAFLFLFQFFYSLPITERAQVLNNRGCGAAKIVFKSNDGGHTWSDISQGLPDNSEPGDFLANERGVYLHAANGIYLTKPNSTVHSSWEKEVFPGEPNGIAAGKQGIYAYADGGQILQKVNGANVWSPACTNFKGAIRAVFETVAGAVFIGSDNGLFKSANRGKTWKQVHAGGWVTKIVESNAALVATSMSGIIRSTDAGETWGLVINDGGVGIDVACINGGFAAISFSTASNTRRVRTSYDHGKTWQPIDAGLQVQPFSEPVYKPVLQRNTNDSSWNPINSGLPEQAFITSIVEVGQYFFCGHPKGVFRSADKGKTWRLILPSVENKLFNLSVSGHVIYAITRNPGC